MEFLDIQTTIEYRFTLKGAHTVLFSTLIKKCNQKNQTKKDCITCSKLIINKLGNSPIGSDFANNEQAFLVFFIAHPEHKLINSFMTEAVII